VPIGVVVPRDARDVVAAVAAARRHGAPILGRGSGTSLAGQCCNEAIVLDFSKYMNAVLGIDAEGCTARVQPGVVLDQLRGAAAGADLTFGPDPATHAYCTLGGMIGNNSCGVRSVMAQFHGPGPTTADNVDSLEVVTYRGLRLHLGALDEHGFARARAQGAGELFTRLQTFQQQYAELIRREFPDIPRRVSGYNLPALLPENGGNVARALVGSESTLALVLEATVRLIPALPHRILVVLGFEDVFTAADRVPEVMSFEPVGCEGFDDRLVRDLRESGLHEEYLQLLPQGGGWLLVEFGAGSHGDALDQARRFMAAIRRSAAPQSISLFDKPEDQHKLWALRESGLAATAHVAGRRRTFPGWEDSAVAPERFGEYLRAIGALFDRYGYHPDLYGHFGQGCLHCRVDFDLHSAPGVATFRRFMTDAADLVHRFGGSLSGEHGDGQARGTLLGRMFSPQMLQAFREFKSIWDPDWRMNPGKVIDAEPLDADLRMGPHYDPPAIRTAFTFEEDARSFPRATTRCVGVGQCRKTEGGTMCPSYMATREEMHSTRGRAHLLFEMLEGDPLQGGWQSEHVHEALDLCLACKGCKQECPVHVDMATYKAEFLSHYYERRWRPRHAYAFGHIRTWARLAALAPGIVNLVGRTPALRRIAGAAAGMAPQRRIPQFAGETFRSWFSRRARGAVRAGGRSGAGRGGEPVILWPDTFNDHFHPSTLKAAVDVLEASGCSVRIPREPLCCGRPLYDFGMLTLARRRLTRVMTALASDIDEGLPIVVLEPSCASVFRDELIALFPDESVARRLRDQTITLAELLARRGALPPVDVASPVLVHGHCHHKAVMGMSADRALLHAAGVEHDLLDSGCCGMAGAFGFERRHYDVSMAVGERVLLPAVRNAGDSTLIVADGFSCREQIAQTTGREALHTVELLHAGIFGARSPFGQPSTVRRRALDATGVSRGSIVAILLAAGITVALARHYAARTRATHRNAPRHHRSGSCR
jgi:FAD/FMN-containing dehydrogenase/Fe-S oxidoreductase